MPAQSPSLTQLARQRLSNFSSKKLMKLEVSGKHLFSLMPAALPHSLQLPFTVQPVQATVQKR